MARGEPAWHRRARRHRAADRVLCAVTSAALRLNAHHSSTPPLVLRPLVSLLLDLQGEVFPAPGRSGLRRTVSFSDVVEAVEPPDDHVADPSLLSLPVPALHSAFDSLRAQLEGLSELAERVRTLSPLVEHQDEVQSLVPSSPSSTFSDPPDVLLPERLPGDVQLQDLPASLAAAISSLPVHPQRAVLIFLKSERSSDEAAYMALHLPPDFVEGGLLDLCDQFKS